jgi:hypothetical protein
MNKVKDSFKYLGHYGGHIYGVKKNGKDGNTSLKVRLTTQDNGKELVVNLGNQSFRLEEVK